MERQDPVHVQNTWAKSVTGKPIHISDAPSGRKGYFCLGCSKDMESVQYKNPLHASYFRHQPRDLVIGETKCTFSDETHRHKIAKEILQRIKKIKVPTVHKYPPEGQDGAPMVLKKPDWVEAETVRNELYFFETSAGKVEWSKKLPIGAYELVKPDVTFFDKEGMPILFIELRATHRVTDEKKARLRNLGIDAVEVILPTGPFEEIEEAFRHTTKTKWLYNGEEHRTRYVRPSIRDSADVPPFDELQRGVFEETYACRKSMVSNLIRAIERCLESEPYRRAEERLGTELSRVAENTDRAREELGRSREDHRGRVEARFAEEIKRLEAEEALLRTSLDDLEARRSNLEGRYQAKRADLETATGEIRGLEIVESQSPRELGSDAGEVERAIEQAQAYVCSEIEEGRRLHREEASLGSWSEEQELAALAEYSRLVRAREDRIGKLEARARGEQEGLGSRREALERDFETQRARLAGASLDPMGQPTTDLERGVKAILDLGGQVARFEETKAERKRVEGARRSFASGDYESWYRP